MFVAKVDVSFEALDRTRLHGASVDIPRPGSAANAAAVLVEGWVVGRVSAVSWVEAVVGGMVIGRARAVHERPDVAAHLEHVAGARASGFRMTVDTIGIDGSTMEIRAFLESGETAHMAMLAFERMWLTGTHPLEHDVVSIVIPCFNQAHFLAEAIDSALNQTYAHTEVVVVDDGSTDNTAEVAARFPSVRYVQQKNAGLAAARNTGIRRSNGEYLLFLDSDDRLRPDAVRIAVAALRARPECAFVSGEHSCIDVEGKQMYASKEDARGVDLYLTLLERNYIGCTAAVLFRRGVFQTVKEFETRLEACGDYDLYLRVARVYPICAVGDILADYRRYGGSMSGDPAKMLDAALLVLGRQRAFAKTDDRRQAIAKGMRFWRDRYGLPLSDEIRRDLRRTGGRVSALKGLWQLLRHAPRFLPDVFFTRQRRSGRPVL